MIRPLLRLASDPERRGPGLAPRSPAGQSGGDRSSRSCELATLGGGLRPPSELPHKGSIAPAKPALERGTRGSRGLHRAENDPALRPPATDRSLRDRALPALELGKACCQADHFE